MPGTVASSTLRCALLLSMRSYVARVDAWKIGWFDYRRKRFWAWVVLTSYTLFGFVIAPLIARSVIVDQVHKQLGVTATLEDVDITRDSYDPSTP